MDYHNYDCWVGDGDFKAGADNTAHTVRAKMLEWNLYFPMLKAALEHWSGAIPAVYLEIISPLIDDVTLEQMLNPFVGC